MTLRDMVVVGMADMNCLKRPGVLTTLGLGSCVGICLFDKAAAVIGLAHCMLPDSRQISGTSVEAKFVDTALKKIIMDMMRLGARKERMQAKLAGGAQMFATAPTLDHMKIGDRNVEAATRNLRALGIPLLAQDTGKNYGRTIEFYSEDFRLLIKTIGHGSKMI